MCPTAAAATKEEFIPVQVEQVKSELNKRYRSRRWRLDNLYNIINDKGVEVKFKMRLCQKLLFLSLWFCSVILKSRQHGITTFACIFFLDTCLFNSNTTAGIIAHNRIDAEEFFKNYVKYPYDNLPQELKDVVTATQDSARKLTFSNNSSIRVTTSGRSGTFQLVHISELGKICAQFPKKALEIKTGTLNAIHPGQIVIIESTAEGREGTYFDMVQEAKKMDEAGEKLTKMDYKYFFFPWWKNPLNVLDPEGVVYYKYQTEYFLELKQKHHINLTPKQKAWYVKKWKVQGDDMKREHPSTPEEAFEAALHGVYYGSEFQLARAQDRITSVPFIPGILVDTWWDLGLGEEDAMSIWFTQDYGRQIHVIDYYENSGEGFKFYRDLLLDDYKVNKGYTYGVWGAPHDIKRKEYSLEGKTRWQYAASIGMPFVRAKMSLVSTGIQEVRNIFPLCVFDEVNTTTKFRGKSVGLPSLEYYRKEWNEGLGSYRNHPLHDHNCHGADAFRTMAMLHKFGAAQLVNNVQQTTQVGSAGPQMNSRQMVQTVNRNKRNPGGWT